MILGREGRRMADEEIQDRPAALAAQGGRLRVQLVCERGVVDVQDVGHRPHDGPVLAVHLLDDERVLAPADEIVVDAVPRGEGWECQYSWRTSCTRR